MASLVVWILDVPGIVKSVLANIVSSLTQHTKDFKKTRMSSVTGNVS